MGSSVKKIFMVLITIVMCVLIGAFLLNILLPNVTTTMINATEDMIHNATGMKFDFNADGIVGGAGNSAKTGANDGTKGTGETIVDGFN